jgi:hypothetical protein
MTGRSVPAATAENVTGLVSSARITRTEPAPPIQGSRTGSGRSEASDGVISTPREAGLERSAAIDINVISGALLDPGAG